MLNNKHKMKKVAFLVPIKMDDSSDDLLIYDVLIPSLLKTLNRCYQYTIYVGIDNGCKKVFDSKKTELNIDSGIKLEVISVEFSSNVQKGHLTKMWNILFSRAFDDGCDYFYQCGDDIVFSGNGWLEESISYLEKNKGYGVSGPAYKSYKKILLTQSLVSRVHMEVFSSYFPEKIINWFCDDWITNVYKRMGGLYVLPNHFLENTGGVPKYNVDRDKLIYDACVNRGVNEIASYLDKQSGCYWLYKLKLFNFMRKVNDFFIKLPADLRAKLKLRTRLMKLIKQFKSQ